MPFSGMRIMFNSPVFDQSGTFKQLISKFDRFSDAGYNKTKLLAGESSMGEFYTF